MKKLIYEWKFFLYKMSKTMVKLEEQWYQLSKKLF